MPREVKKSRRPDGVVLKFKREHGFSHFIPITDKADRPLASFVGVPQDHPWMARPIDTLGGPKPQSLEPQADDKMYWRNAWQRILVYSSDDGSLEVSMHVGFEHQPKPEITVKVT